MLWGLGTVLFVFPLASEPLRLTLKARWSRQLLDAFGIRLETAGRPAEGGLLVANHISWLDIFAINAVAPSAFVSKDDVRQWPLIGWWATGADTIFLERGSRSAALRAKRSIAEYLRRRRRVCVFPEGTTGFGAAVMPFHGALFQSAIDAGVSVLPAMLRYTERGRHSLAPAYVGDTPLVATFLAIARARRLVVQVVFLPGLDTVAADRRHLAATAHRAITRRLDRPEQPADGDTDEAADLIGAAVRQSGG